MGRIFVPLILLATLGSACADSMDDDPVGDKLLKILTSDKDSDSWIKRDVEITPDDPTATVDCGEVWSDDTRVVQVTIHNRLDLDFEAASIHTSCGCIAGLPNAVSIPAQKSETLKVVFTVPTAVGQFDRIITITEKSFEQKFRIRLSGTSVYRFVAPNPDVVLESRGAHDVSLEIERVGEESFSNCKWSFGQAMGNLVEVQPDELGATATIKFRFETPKDGVATEEVVYLMATKDDKTMVSLPIRMIYAFKAYTVPTRIVLKPRIDSYSATFILHKGNFIEKGKPDAEKTMLLFVPKNVKPIKCVANARRVNDSSSVIQLKVSAEEVKDWIDGELGELEIDGSMNPPLRVSVFKN
jgi:hypothetical protein